jgi:hypothetical protein
VANKTVEETGDLQSDRTLDGRLEGQAKEKGWMDRLERNAGGAGWRGRLERQAREKG